MYKEKFLYKANPFRKIKWVPFQNEKQDVQKLFEDNLQSIFPNLIWITDEYSFEKSDEKDEGFRVDGVSYFDDGKIRTFILFEFKKEISDKLLDQSRTYINILRRKANNADKGNLLHLINSYLLENELLGNELIGKKDINWGEARIFCVAPNFNKFQRNSLDEEEEKRIILMEVNKYEEDVLIMEIIGGKVPEWLRIENAERETQGVSFAFQEVFESLEKEQWISQGVKEWSAEAEKFIFSLGNLKKEVWTKENYSPRIRYYDLTTNKALVSLIVRARQVNVYWNFGNSHEISQSLKGLLDKYGIFFSKKQHGVIGNWFFLIRDRIALQNLGKFIEEYKRGDWKA